MEQVIPHNVLQRSAAEIHDVAVGQHNFYAKDVLFGHPVLHAGGPAGVFRNGPSQCSAEEALRIRWKEEPLLHEPYCQILEHNTGLYRCSKVLFINLQYPVHLCGTENDPAHDRDRPAAYVCTASPWCNGDLFTISELHNIRYLLCACGKDHYIGLVDPA